jgi:hypothetical protein
MEQQPHFNLIMQFYNGNITLQEYIDSICNLIDNNQVRGFLRQFLSATQELENQFGLINQNESPYFDVYADDGEVYRYFIRKIPYSGHYCLYVSISADHPLHGESYENVQDATYCSPDVADLSRWVFGWDYANFDICTPSILHLLAGNDPRILLDKRIITASSINNDAYRYINILSQVEID